MKAREVTFIVTALILGAVVGGLIGEIIADFLPPEGAAKTVFAKNIPIGFDTVQLDFYAISFRHRPEIENKLHVGSGV